MSNITTACGAWLPSPSAGTTQVLAGIDGGRAPFRVLARTSPSRLVVDVQHPTGD